MTVFTTDFMAQTSTKINFPPTYVVIFIKDFTFELIAHCHLDIYFSAHTQCFVRFSQSRSSLHDRRNQQAERSKTHSVVDRKSLNELWKKRLTARSHWWLKKRGEARRRIWGLQKIRQARTSGLELRKQHAAKARLRRSVLQSPWNPLSDYSEGCLLIFLYYFLFECKECRYVSEIKDVDCYIEQ